MSDHETFILLGLLAGVVAWIGASVLAAILWGRGMTRLKARRNARPRLTLVVEDDTETFKLTQLAHHLASAHCDGIAMYRSDAENLAAHEHEHTSRATLRYHSVDSLHFDLDKVEAVLVELEEMDPTFDYDSFYETPDDLMGLAATVDVDPEPTYRPRRYDQCFGDCTVDCGHCKGQGPPELAARYTNRVLKPFGLTSVHAGCLQAWDDYATDLVCQDCGKAIRTAVTA